MAENEDFPCLEFTHGGKKTEKPIGTPQYTKPLTIYSLIYSRKNIGSLLAMYILIAHTIFLGVEIVHTIRN